MSDHGHGGHDKPRHAHKKEHHGGHGGGGKKSGEWMDNAITAGTLGFFASAEIAKVIGPTIKEIGSSILKGLGGVFKFLLRMIGIKA